MQGEGQRAKGASAWPPHSEVCSLWLTIYQRYHEEIRCYLAGYVKCPEDVEDLLQDVLLAVMAQEHIPEDPHTYLRAVAKNRMLAHWRKRQAQRTLEQHLLAESRALDQAQSASSLDPCEQFYLQEQRDHVTRALHQMPTKLAAILKLRIVDALPVEEAARRAGCSPAVLKRRLALAKRLLARLCDNVG